MSETQNQVPASDPSGTPVITTTRTLDESVGESTTPVTNPEQAVVTVAGEEVGQDVVGFASDLHRYLQQNITWADTKAAFLFAAAGALIAYLHNHGLTKRIAPRIFDFPNTLSNTVGMIAYGALILAAGAAFRTFWPRTRGDAEGIVFWKAIATKYNSGHAFAETVMGRNPRALADAKLQHCWELAKVCEGKFKSVNMATMATAFGAVVTLLYLVIWNR